MKPSEFLSLIDLESHGHVSNYPLGNVAAVQRLISLYSNNSSAFSALYDQGVPKILDRGLISTALSFLNPNFDSASERRAARKYQQKILESQRRWPDLASIDSTVALVCSDANPTDLQPPQLYAGHDAQLAEWSGFNYLLSQIIEVTSAGKISSSHGVSEVSLSALTTILLELFKNTHDHATHEISGADIPWSLRGIYAKYYTANEIQNLSALLRKRNDRLDPSLAYCSSVTDQSSLKKIGVASGLNAPGVMEISVFDSGPGMAARWEGQDVSASPSKLQLQSVIKCLSKGQTSTMSVSRGFGLWQVLRSLEEVKGFIRIRTNGVNGFRRFDWEPYMRTAQHKTQGQRPIPIESLWDWDKGFAPNPSRYPEVRGTVVSLLVPMVAV